MRTDLLDQSAGVVLTRTRLLCLAAGICSGLGGMLLYGPLFWIFPALSILSALVHPYLRRPGIWLLSIGAFILTIYTLMFIVPEGVDGIIGFTRGGNSFPRVAFVVLAPISGILVIWSDVALVIDTRRPRKLGDRRDVF